MIVVLRGLLDRHVPCGVAGEQRRQQQARDGHRRAAGHQHVVRRQLARQPAARTGGQRHSAVPGRFVESCTSRRYRRSSSSSCPRPSTPKTRANSGCSTSSAATSRTLLGPAPRATRAARAAARWSRRVRRSWRSRRRSAGPARRGCPSCGPAPPVTIGRLARSERIDESDHQEDSNPCREPICPNRFGCSCPTAR